MSDKVSNEQLRNTWEAAAPGWAKWEKTFSAHLDGVTELLLDMAEVRVGSRVLDVASGAGDQTLQAAKRAGPQGHVVASDISATMLSHVRKSAEREGLSNIETLESSADDYNLSLTKFDSAICRFGLMLFPSPAKAIQSIRGVLNPGARLGVVVVTTPQNNPSFSQPMNILLDHADKQPPAPGQPGLFVLGGDGVLENLLNECGLKDVQTRVMRAPIRVANVDDALSMMQQAFGAYRAVVSDLDEFEREKAWSAVRDCLSQYENENGYEAEIEVMIGCGRNP
ncbi:MAG: class I SAM-dependent methyltransferase [Gammaproteobacteria bacterium]|nr:class I SAM-dependent methyltransferase [Gammaproteobacteria bacterium]